MILSNQVVITEVAIREEEVIMMIDRKEVRISRTKVMEEGTIEVEGVKINIYLCKITETDAKTTTEVATRTALATEDRTNNRDTRVIAGIMTLLLLVERKSALVETRGGL